MAQNYQNLVFTHHAEARLKKRNLSLVMVWETINHSDKKFSKGKNFKFIKLWQGRRVQVIADYLPKEKKYLVISVWVRGEDDPKPWWWQIIAKLARIK